MNAFVLWSLPFLAFTFVQAQPLPTSSQVISPGVTHKEYTLPGPLTVDVLEVERNAPGIRMESYRPHGLVKTSVQAEANDRPGHRVIAAINADFFSFQTGLPVGNQVVNGQFALGIHSRRSHLALDSTMRPYIERLAFSGSLRTGRGDTASIAGVNITRDSGLTVFYTSFKGDSTGTDAHGVECALEFVVSTPTAGDTVKARITARSSAGNMHIPALGGVLSAGSGSPASMLANAVSIGDTISLFLGFDRPLSRITQVLGGAGRILIKGRYVADSMAALEGIKTTFTDVRHPRTFFGFNADTSRLYLCTVDGRQVTSRGMTFAEMASFLLSTGVTEAFNFDGGGSTTMVVSGAIVNSPSDTTGERRVANSLQVINIAPFGTLRTGDQRSWKSMARETGVLEIPGPSMLRLTELPPDFSK